MQSVSNPHSPRLSILASSKSTWAHGNRRNLDPITLCMQRLSGAVHATYPIIILCSCLLPTRLEDPRSGPLAELAKWQRRQVILTSVVEQLKVKECKTVLTALAVTKSRLLKKWKTIDMQ